MRLARPFTRVAWLAARPGRGGHDPGLGEERDVVPIDPVRDEPAVPGPGRCRHRAVRSSGQSPVSRRRAWPAGRPGCTCSAYSWRTERPDLLPLDCLNSGPAGRTERRLRVVSLLPVMTA